MWNGGLSNSFTKTHNSFFFVFCFFFSLCFFPFPLYIYILFTIRQLYFIFYFYFLTFYLVTDHFSFYKIFKLLTFDPFFQNFSKLNINTWIFTILSYYLITNFMKTFLILEFNMSLKTQHWWEYILSLYMLNFVYLLEYFLKHTLGLPNYFSHD